MVNYDFNKRSIVLLNHVSSHLNFVPIFSYEFFQKLRSNLKKIKNFQNATKLKLKQIRSGNYVLNKSNIILLNHVRNYLNFVSIFHFEFFLKNDTEFQNF